jgi:cytochrome c-type biogenesis protein CcmF
MENLGALAILLAFCLSLYSIAGSLAAKWKGNAFLAVSAERAVYGVWFLVTFASGLLVYALMAGDFRLAFVAAHTDTSMSAIYKFTAWWGGQEGSLLFWTFILVSYAAVVVWQSRTKFREMMPYVIAVMMTVSAFFLLLIGFVASPFQVLMQGKGIIDVGNGNGLNPSLQYWAMAIHPPFLYLGYVGFTVPFAFAIASLLTRQPGQEWMIKTRRWNLATWFFQSCGIILGAGWAYAALGWGGYWAWDPVENASLLPWLSSTAFIHSVMMQEKKGMMKVWNVVLVATTFFLCIFGTMLTRSGLVSSVHAFAQSSIGSYFAIFLAVGIAGTVWLILDRLPYLKSESQLESVVSRESSFLFNNLILLASCFAVLWGTLFPVISEAAVGEKVSVDAPFYNRVNIPIGLFLLFLTGVGPLIAWRKSSVESLRRAFMWPTLAMVLIMIVLGIVGVRHPYALLTFGLCTFVSVTIGSEFYKGARAIAAKTGQNLIAAMIELTHRNTRRYGGYVVHMGIVLMFIGFAGAAFNKDATVEVKLGDKFQLAHYELRVREVNSGENDNYQWHRAKIDAYRGGEFLQTLEPERRFYKASRQPNSHVAIRRRLNEDLYLNFASMTEDGQRAIVQAFVFPLVTWIWIGFVVLAFGTFVCLLPNKTRVRQAQPEPAAPARSRERQYAAVSK